MADENRIKLRKKKTVRIDVSGKEPEITLTKVDREELKRDLEEKMAAIPEAEISNITASIADPSYIESETRVVINKTLNKAKINGDYSKTVMDPSMSPTPTCANCQYCGYDIDNCAGHPGRIALNEKVYHVSYIRIIIDILNCVCRSCAVLKLNDKTLEEMGLKKAQDLRRLKLISNKLKAIRCHNKGCHSREYEGEIASKKSEQSGRIFLKKTKENTEREIPIDIIYNILSKISPEDYRSIGLDFRLVGGKIIGTHPKNFIIQYLIVSAPKERRDYMVNGEWKINDKTKLLDRIVMLNNAIEEYRQKEFESAGKKAKNAAASALDNTKTELFKSIASLIDSDKYQVKIYGAKQLRGIKQDLTGKDRMVRKNMQSRTVNYVIRTVTTPDPTLEYGQIGVSEEVADEQTFPETVTFLNIVFLTRLLRNGGVNSIVPTVGKSKNMIIQVNKQIKEGFDLEVGMIVNRKIMNGDLVVSNRNPSIHMYSMMGGTAVRRKQKTVSPHMAQTTPGQIDFDGDEMQLHFAQTIQAAANIRSLMHLSEIMMNVQSNKPVIGAVYDIPLGLYLLTRKGGKISKSTFWNNLAFLKANEQLDSLMSRAKRYGLPITIQNDEKYGFSLDTEEMYNGRLFFSALLPADFYYEGYGINIKNGILLDGAMGKPGKSGVVTKNAVGTSHNSIIQVMWITKGAQRTKDFVTDLYLTINGVYTELGMTLGFEDAKVTDPVILSDIEKKAWELVEKYERLEIPSDMDKAAWSRYEREVMQIVSDITNYSSKKLEGIKNNLVEIAASGAKGNLKNLVAIMDKVGQQTLAGERLVPQLRDGGVTFNFFDPSDRTLLSQGFVDHSYAEGLTLEEYTMHGAASREQLVNVSISTRMVGYDHRSLIKWAEDLTTTEDCSVRNKGVVVQTSFGGHSLNPEYLMLLDTKWGKVPQPLNIKQMVGHLNSLFGVEKSKK